MSRLIDENLKKNILIFFYYLLFQIWTLKICNHGKILLFQIWTLKICNHGKIPAVLFEYFDTAICRCDFSAFPTPVLNLATFMYKHLLGA